VQLVLRLAEHHCTRAHDRTARAVLSDQQRAFAAGDAPPEGLGPPVVERRHEADRGAAFAVDKYLGQGGAPFVGLLGRERADRDTVFAQGSLVLSA
jgi:hypothetical protein